MVEVIKYKERIVKTHRKNLSGMVALCIAALFAQPLMLAGCAGGNRRVDREPAQTEAKTIVRTTVHLVNAEDMTAFSNGTMKIDVDGEPVTAQFPGTAEEKAAFVTRLKTERDAKESQSGAFLILAAVWIAERVMDAIVKEVKKRASEYTAEYAMTSSGVWVPANGAAPRIEGIIVRRDRFEKVNGVMGYKGNEMCVVYRLAEVPRGTPGSGLYDATPIYAKISTPKARTSFFGDNDPKITTTAKLVLETAGPAGRGASTVLDYSFIATRMTVGKNAKALVSRDDLNRRSNLFALPLNSPTAVGLNVRVSVTEVDQGYDAKILEAIGGVLDKNKSQVVDVVKSVVSEVP